MVGPRILAGQIERGVGERMRAVILASDLRGFTRLSDRLPGDAVIELLDEFFERIVEPVHQTGGDVLKFIGDGMLAIFPAPPGEEESATQAALEGARKAVRRLEEWKQAAPENQAYYSELVRLLSAVAAVAERDVAMQRPAAADVVRLAAPVYVKLGLRNAPNIYPAGLHLEDLAVKLGRERVRRAELVLRLLQERAPELVEGRGEDRPADLGIPEP